MAQGEGGGRPKKLTPALLKKAEKYLDERKDKMEVVTGARGSAVTYMVKLPTIEGLARYLHVSRSTIYEWQGAEAGDTLNEKFSDIIEDLQAEQADRLINQGLGGNYNSTIAKVLMTKHGYVEKSEVDQNLSGAVAFVNDVPRPKGE